MAEYNPKFTAFLQGFVPPFILSLFFSLVPTFMLMLSHQECPVSESDAQVSAIWVRPCVWDRATRTCLDNNH